jgi:putative hemolysin
MISILLGFLICLFLSAFLSIAEMAFVSSNKIKIRELADSGHDSAKKLIGFQDNAEQFLTSILIGNNITNITGTTLVAYLLQSHFGITNEWVITAIIAPILIIFGETVPKDYGRIKSQAFLLNNANFLGFLIKIFHYPAVFLLKGVDFLLAPFGWNPDRNIFVSEREFRSMIEESVATGVLATHEKQLIDTILDFERIHVESVMFHADKVPKVEIHDTVGKVKALARETKARMVLVYEEIPSIVVAMIYVFDILFEADDNQTLKNYLRSPIFIPRNTSIEKAFLTLQEKRQSFAVVTDIHGEVIGVVPIERLFNL